MSDYPEHDRMMATKPVSEHLGAFLEWLAEQGIVFAKWEWIRDCGHESGPYISTADDGQRLKWRCTDGRMVGHPDSNKPGVVGGECKECNGTGTIERSEPRLTPTGDRIETVLARYFDIDLDKIAAEKQAMVDQLQRRAS